MFDNLKLGTKLLGSFLVVVGLASALVLFGLQSQRQTTADIAEVADVRLPSILGLEIMGRAQASVRLVNIGLFLDNPDPNHIERMEKSLAAALADAEKGWAIYEPLPQTAEEARVWAEFVPAWRVWKTAAQQAAAMAKESRRDAAAKTLAISFVFGELNEKYVKTFVLLERLIQINEKIASESSVRAKDVEAKTEKRSLVAIFVGLLLALTLGLKLTFSLKTPIAEAVKMMSEMAVGRLGRRLKLKRDDEVGEMARAMDSFADSLQNGMVAVLKKAAAGDLSSTIKARDAQDEISPALLSIHVALNALVDETRALTEAALGGDLSVRGEAEKFSGAYRSIIEGVNGTLDAVIQPISEAASVLQKVAEKDMTARVMGDYKGDHAKIKAALNTAVSNLEKSLQQVSVSGEQVAAASQQIGTGSQTLARGTSEQASSLEEISSNLQELTSMTKQNTVNAQAAKSLADGTRSGVATGTESMRNLSAAVERIKMSSDDTAKIVKTIDEIAFQTNLLALNAAVEAARAGDAGKGFAVVAEEVRNLAMRSAEAAKSTANLIEESVKNAEDGVKLNEEVTKGLENISKQVQKVGEVMSEISAASEQQSQGIEQVNNAILQMNQLTQQNASTAEESASAAEELTSQAKGLQKLVVTFKIGEVDGHEKHPAAPKSEPAPAPAPAPEAEAAPKAAPRPRPKAAPRAARKTEPARKSILAEGNPREGDRPLDPFKTGPFEDKGVLKEF